MADGSAESKATKYSGPSGVEYDSVHRMRVNGTYLQQYHGKPVCLLGTVIKAEGGGPSFKIKSSDGQTINVRMKNSVAESLSGLVEVYGIGQGKNLILADNFTVFPTSMTADFDMVGYNDMIIRINTQNDDNPFKPPA